MKRKVYRTNHLQDFQNVGTIGSKYKNTKNLNSETYMLKKTNQLYIPPQ